jgi:hypothetical protein
MFYLASPLRRRWLRNYLYPRPWNPAQQDLAVLQMMIALRAVAGAVPVVEVVGVTAAVVAMVATMAVVVITTTMIDKPSSGQD